jgi:hypothetical protein
MKIELRDGLPFVGVSVVFRGKSLDLPTVLLDTGSAGTVLSADRVFAAGIQMEPNDTIHRIRGVGGSEFVFAKRVDRLGLGELQALDFEVEVGGLAYGFELDGILGLDFLLQVSAIIDLKTLDVRPAD